MEPVAPLFVPLWTTHSRGPEGGRKLHLASVTLESTNGHSLCKTPEQRGHLCNCGDPIPDLGAWLATDASGEVCKRCEALAVRMLAPVDCKAVLRKKIAASTKAMRKIDREIAALKGQVSLAQKVYSAEGQRYHRWQDELATIEWREACMAGTHGPLVTLSTGTTRAGPGTYAITYFLINDLDPKRTWSFKQVDVHVKPVHDCHSGGHLDIRSSEGCVSGDGEPISYGNGSVGDPFSDADIAVILSNLPRLPGGAEALVFLRTWSPLAPPKESEVSP